MADLIDHIAKPHLREVLPLALARDLRQERDVRLREAGQETEKPIYLDDLFVDLPFRASALSVQSAEELEDEDSEDNEVRLVEEESGAAEHLPVRVVAQLLRRAADKLDSESTACPPQPRKGRAEPQPNRVVILGGPGQGKSTLGQFLAQVSRARLLSEHAKSLLNPQTSDLISPILERARMEGLPLHGPARFPIRIDLPVYADALQKSGSSGVSLIAFAAQRLSRNVDQSISPSELRTWLSTCPALIILDGLDEVPPSGNRTELIKSIDALWDDLSLVQADVLVVVTTRPQGYNDDLSARYWQHWELSALTPRDALKFARRLAEVRLSDPDRRDVILSELGRAAADSSTMLLLTSPLQVTIMFGISLLKGAIPQDRWELFERYYTLLRDREAQKTGADAKLIREFKRQIDAIHHQSGFILHVVSESAGGASAHLTLAQFRTLITRLLVDEGHSAEDISKISSELVRVATERLVLLNCRVERQIAFDVRSLQEFMAAAQIAAFSSTIVIQRLRTIALSTHWQHVFRIAASKIFSVAELGPLRSEVIAICHAADNGDLGEDGRLVRAGAKLALELLQDGIAHTAPAFRRSLARRALAQLDIGPEMLDDRLAIHLVSDTAKVFLEELTSRIAQGQTPAAKASWALLSRLLDIDRDFSEPLMTANWPDIPEHALDVVDVLRGKWTSPLIDKVKEAQALAGPSVTAEFTESLDVNPRVSETEISPIDQFSILPLGVRRNIHYSRPSFSVRDSKGKQIFEIGFVRLEESPSFVISADLQTRENWAGYRALVSFLENPSKRSLAEMLRQLAVHGREGIPNHSLPWVCLSMFREQNEGMTFERLAQEADDGLFGDLSEWAAAERRWLTDGARPSDFEPWASGRYLQPEICARGVSHPQPIVQTSASSDTGSFAELVDVALSIRPTYKRLRLFEILLNLLRSRWRAEPNSASLSPDLVDTLCRHAIGAAKEVGSSRNSRLINYLGGVEDCWRMPDFLDLADQFGSRSRPLSGRPAEAIVSAFNAKPSRRGLLAFLVARSRGLFPRPELAKLDESALCVMPADSESIRYSVARLRLSVGKWGNEDVEGIVQALERRSEDLLFSGFAGLADLADHGSYPALLRAMCSGRFPARRSLRRTVRTPLQLLAREVGRQPSALSDASTCAALDLPTVPVA